MASLKPVVRLSQIKIDKKCNIKIRLCSDRKVTYLATPFNIEPKYMNADGTISNKYPGQAKLNMALNLLMADYNSALEEIGKDIIYMDINTIARRIKQGGGTGVSFSKYIKQRIKTLEEEKRTSYAGTYKAAVKHLEAFTGKTDLLFKEINLDFLQRFERWLIVAEKRTNSRRIYLNVIRAVFNHAIDNDVIKIELFPFRKFKVKSEKTLKKNLDADVIKKLRSLTLSPARQRAFDLWLLSFYLLGINFKDMLYLTSKSIENGRIHYMRYKTKGKKLVEMSVKLVPEAKAIIDKYRGEKYLLCFLDQQSKNRKTPRYKDITKDTNKLLKKICKQAGMDIELSTNYARHSVGTIAYKLGIPESTISEMLGHSDGIPVTNVYIQRDYNRIDKAQRRVINQVSGPLKSKSTHP